MHRERLSPCHRRIEANPAVGGHKIIQLALDSVDDDQTDLFRVHPQSINHFAHSRRPILRQRQPPIDPWQKLARKLNIQCQAATYSPSKTASISVSGRSNVAP
jgi:hypothetical protein